MQEFAAALLSGPWNAEAVAERGAAHLGHWPEWLDGLALHLASMFRTPPPPAALALTLGRLIDVAALAEPAPPPPPRPPQRRSARRAPSSSSATAWPVRPFDSEPELADALELDLGQLAWLADTRGIERTVRSERLRNYRYLLVPRRSGPPRVIEMPKARLKEIQRFILREILDRIPSHDAAHGFVKGRSARSHASVHAGRRYVVRFDLHDFFASIPAHRVRGIFALAGYPVPVARALTGLCTNVVPGAVWASYPFTADVTARYLLGRALATPHLPQGGPTSPALANLAAFRLDRRLAGLAAGAGMRYSRYADDLAFSGPPPPRRLAEYVERIAVAEGFRVHHGKTRIASRAARQTVCGIVVNDRPNVTRREYDTLKAILHNAAVHGPAGQNRAGVPDFRAHLAGRIAWVAALNPARGAKLRARMDAIDWSARP